jgi:hypothetical protein
MYDTTISPILLLIYFVLCLWFSFDSFRWWLMKHGLKLEETGSQQ